MGGVAEPRNSPRGLLHYTERRQVLTNCHEQSLIAVIMKKLEWDNVEVNNECNYKV